MTASSCDDAALDAVCRCIDAPDATRANELEQWLVGATDASEAAGALARALEAFEPTAANPGERGDLARLLSAERVWAPLSRAAEACTDRHAASLLWSLASEAASASGELADTPYTLARRAVQVSPESPRAWRAFEQALRSDTTAFFEDFAEWLASAQRHEIEVSFCERALAAAQAASGDLSEDAVDELADLAREVARLARG